MTVTMSDEVNSGSQKDDAKEESTDESKEESTDQPSETKLEYLGQELTADELVDKLREKDAHITRREQELAEFKKSDEAPAAGPELDEMQQAEIKRARKQLGLPEDGSLDEFLEKKLAEREAKSKVNSLMETMKTRYSGEGDYKDYPKFEEAKVLDYMQQNNVWEPEVAYKAMNHGKILDAEIKRVGKKKTPQGDTSDAPKTEATDKETIEKIAQTVGGDPTKLADAMTKLGMGSLPR